MKSQDDPSIDCLEKIVSSSYEEERSDELLLEDKFTTRMQKFYSEMNLNTAGKTPDSIKKIISPVKSDNTISSYISFGK